MSVVNILKVEKWSKKLEKNVCRAACFTCPYKMKKEKMFNVHSTPSKNIVNKKPQN